jgi:hypothetical protein
MSGELRELKRKVGTRALVVLFVADHDLYIFMTLVVLSLHIGHSLGLLPP